MKLNETLALSTPKLLLVPTQANISSHRWKYSVHHVPTYHTWMQSPALQTATASDPLTLDAEYAMQRSWRTDHDKLTFIICLPLNPDYADSDSLSARQHDDEERMVGDINLFLAPSPTELDDAKVNVVGEIELMIALPTLQRKGLGRAALVTFMAFILTSWPAVASEYRSGSDIADAGLPRLEYLRARINETNERSIALFESVGFKKVGEGANYFGEVELRWIGSLGDAKGLKGYEGPRELKYQE